MRSLARSYTGETIRRLAAIMRDPGADESPSVSVSAAIVLLGYGHGKPAQPHVGDDDQPIAVTIRKIIDGGNDDDGPGSG